MKIEDINLTRNNIPGLTNLSDLRYENVFKMAKNNNFYFYNVLKNVQFPTVLNEGLFYVKTINRRLPYTTISYQEYGTQDLWWLIALANKITNPVAIPKPGTNLKIIKKKYIKRILDTIKSLNNV